MAIKDLYGEIKGYRTRMDEESREVQNMLNLVRRLEDDIKKKPNGEEIDALSTLVHEIYEKFVDFEKRHGGDAAAFINSLPHNS